MSEPILSVKGVGCFKDDNQVIFDGISFAVNDGDLVVLQGKSGSGKTTLLKCLAHLNVYKGEVLYHGKTPTSYGIPAFRTRVLYIPQRPSLLPGTPREFHETIASFASRKQKGAHPADVKHCIDLGKTWNVDAELWDRNWSNLSGGESQRIALAVGLGLNAAEVLLLDEPTSALDPDASAQVEKTIMAEIHSSEAMLKATVWVTHSEEQGRRIGTRFLHITPSGVEEEPALVSTA